MQIGRRDLQDPVEQQDEKDVYVVPLGPASECDAASDQEFVALQRFPEHQKPTGRKIRLWREHLREIMPLELPHSAEIDVEETVTARFDPEQHEGDQHGEDEYPVICARRGERDRENSAATVSAQFVVRSSRSRQSAMRAILARW